MRRTHLLALVAILFLPSICSALVVYDDAAGPVYGSGRPNGSNGGIGFRPWLALTMGACTLAWLCSRRPSMKRANWYWSTHSPYFQRGGVP
jgi:hypothetical protein